MRELKDYITVMEKNLNNQDDPMVGIFWYSVEDDELFGVHSVSINNFSKPNSAGGLISCSELHKKVWAKLYNKYKFKKQNQTNPYDRDYKDVPRGRVFYNIETEEFEICVGSWVREYGEKHIKELIMEEFQLDGQFCKLYIKEHWEIGNGWGD